MELDSQINCLKCNGKYNFTLSHLQNRLLSSENYNKILFILTRLCKVYKNISNDLIAQINRISNLRTSSLAQFYSSFSITPPKHSHLHCLIDSFRDSIIINYQDTVILHQLIKSSQNYPSTNLLAHLDTTHHTGLYDKEDEATTTSNSQNNGINSSKSEVNFDIKSKRKLSRLDETCKHKCVDDIFTQPGDSGVNERYSAEKTNNYTVDDILLHSLKNPSSAFKTPLLREIFSGLDDLVLSYIIANSQVFLPELIIYLSNQSWISCLLLSNEESYRQLPFSREGITRESITREKPLTRENPLTGEFTNGIVRGDSSEHLQDFESLRESIEKSHNFINQILNGIRDNNLKSIYFQICGRPMSREAISLKGKISKGVTNKQQRWANVYIHRSRIMYRSSFNNFSLPSCSLLKFTRPLTRMQCRVLLNNILFNNDLTDDKKEHEVVKKIKKSVDLVSEEGGVRFRGKSLICSIADHFYVFMAKLHDFNFKEYLDRYCPTRIGHLNEYIQLSQIPSLDYSTDIDDVVAYVEDVINNLITDDLLGNNHNKLIFLKTCRTLVTLNRNETLNIDRVIRNINTKKCKWLQINSKNAYNRTLVIRNYLSKLIYILHNHLTCPLLWSSFYITESGNSINKLYYFRKSDWYKLERIADLHLSNSNYVISDKSIEYNKIRWVPKNKGMRPIWNLSNLPASSEFIESLDRQQCMCNNNSSTSGYKCFKCYTTSVQRPKNKSSISRNTFLYLPRVILSYLCRYKSKLMGCSVMGYTQVYRRLSKWWNHFCSISRNTKEDYNLYIIVADLSMCYESISHKDLINVVNELPIPRQFIFTRGYSRAFTRLSLNSKTLGSFGKCVDIVDTNSIDGCDNWLKKFKRQTILKSLIGGGVSVVSSLDNCQISITRTNINEIITTLLKTLTITLKPMGIGKVIMKQTCGIPQGCCISSFLCSFYMANKDRLISKLLTSKIVSKKNKVTVLPNLLLRWIDDFIFISPNKDDAMQMSKILLDAEVFDARLNLNKLNANFEPYNQSQLEWLGMTFSFDIPGEKINIQIEPWRNSSNVIRDSFSFKISNNFMQTMLIDRLYGYLSNRLCHGLFSCSKLNSRHYITKNVYVIMRICMLKLVCGINSIIFEFGGFINYKFIIDTIFNLVEHTLTLISRRCKLYGNYKYQLKTYLLTAVTITLNSLNQMTFKNKELKLILITLLNEYHKRVKLSKMPGALKRIILCKNKTNDIANKIGEIEAKFDGKWPSVHIR